MSNGRGRSPKVKLKVNGKHNLSFFFYFTVCLVLLREKYFSKTDGVVTVGEFIDNGTGDLCVTIILNKYKHKFCKRRFLI